MPKKMSQEEKFRMMTEDPIPGLVGRLAVPTIIFSFYGMNTGTLPLVDQWYWPFLIALCVSVITALVFTKSKLFK